jgi:glycerate kinase
MKIVIAPDKFKGSLTAIEAANAIAEGVRRILPDAQLDLCPIADGGEGTVAALVAATGGRTETRRVTGPLAEMKVDASFGILGNGKTAAVEMAAASGLALLPDQERNPLFTTTYGTGELLMAAAALGVREIILGIGGSATIDAGVGCAQACGLPVILEGGEPVSPGEPLTGGDLSRVVLVKHGRGSPIERVSITVACDVTNPLFGPSGAAFVYGPQKGATPEIVRDLDDALRAFAQRTGKLAEAQAPGAGAAGGLGFAMLAFFGATLRPGADLIIDATDLRQRLRGADLCITGEGRLDASSHHGKAPMAVAQLCQEVGVPCAAIAGCVGEGEFSHMLIRHRAITSGGIAIEEAMERAAPLLSDAAAAFVSEITAKNFPFPRRSNLS